MNPLSNVESLKRMNEKELKLGLTGTNQSWHAQYKDSAWVFTGGLPYDLTEGDVITVFSQYGEIVNVNLVRDKQTGKSRGFAFICYEDQRSTVLAVDNFNGARLLGRTIRVDHVKDYKMPKEDETLDDITKRLRAEGCAPQSYIATSAASGGPASSAMSDQSTEVTVKVEPDSLTRVPAATAQTGVWREPASRNNDAELESSKAGRKLKKEKKLKKHKHKRCNRDPSDVTDDSGQTESENDKKRRRGNDGDVHLSTRSNADVAGRGAFASSVHDSGSARQQQQQDVVLADRGTSSQAMAEQKDERSWRTSSMSAPKRLPSPGIDRRSCSPAARGRQSPPNPSREGLPRRQRRSPSPSNRRRSSRSPCQFRHRSRSRSGERHRRRSPSDVRQQRDPRSPSKKRLVHCPSSVNDRRSRSPSGRRHSPAYERSCELPRDSRRVPSPVHKPREQSRSGKQRRSPSAERN